MISGLVNRLHLALIQATAPWRIRAPEPAACQPRPANAIADATALTEAGYVGEDVEKTSS